MDLWRRRVAILERRALAVNVRLMGAPTRPLAEGSVADMGGSKLTNPAVMTDALDNHRKEACVGSTGESPLSKLAGMKDAQTESTQEESALGMEQRSKLAVMKDAPTMFKKEESVSDTGQRSIINNAATRDAPT